MASIVELPFSKSLISLKSSDDGQLTTENRQLYAIKSVNT
jgi:hypothetical protein